MIIHHPEIIHHGDHSLVYAEVEIQAHDSLFPRYVWYRVPNRYAAYLSLQSDAFLMPCLLAAMNFGENIDVVGAASPSLAFHLDEYQYLMNLYFPKKLRRVKINYQRLEALAVRPTAVGCTFSGGVDSFFTLHMHNNKPQPSSDYHITHALFIQGFDIVRADALKYHELFIRYQAALAEIGVELVPIETNVASVIVPRMDFSKLYGPVLTGSALSLAGLFRRFIISNSWTYLPPKVRTIAAQFTISTNPLTDRLQSTETLDMLHFGAWYYRSAKLIAISDWAIAKNNLRVCAHPKLGPGVLNCSRCGKCIRTMIPLYAIGKLAHFPTFHRPLKTNRHILRWARKYETSKSFQTETLRFVKEHKPDALFLLIMSMILGNLRLWAIKLLPKFIKNLLGRYGLFREHLREAGALDNPEVIDLIRSRSGYGVSQEDGNDPAYS